MKPSPRRLVREPKLRASSWVLFFLGFCVAAGAAYPAEPGSDSNWYIIAAGACEQKDPREMLALGKLLGVSMDTRDIKENGKIVTTTISAADGSSATYYRGRARCEAALAREMKELDRYN